MKFRFKFLILGFFLNAIPMLPTLDAAYTLKDGKIIDASQVATMSLEEHYNAGVKALEASDWYGAANQFGIAAANFPLSPYGQEAAFFQGVALFNLGEYDLANEAFTSYLQGKSTPRLFEETLEYKFAIAEQFRQGARRRLFGSKKLPKWAPGDDSGIKIYEEIIAAVPSHEYAIKSLFSKALLHWKRKEYSEAVEAFQMITRRFPKHEYAPESYLLINRVYLDQSRKEFQNPDILSFAEINLRRFAASFPSEERLSEAENDVLAIKEVYAKGYFDTGLFYERLGKPQAAVLYYRHAVIQFPETVMASYSNRRLGELGFEVVNENKEQPQEEATESTKENQTDSIEWIP